jgi:Lon protease-like protein
MPLHLHIFEERYKKMLNLCIAAKKPFGVVLIKSGSEAGGAAEPFEVGCTALVEKVQPLSEGRMNMSAVGKTRFKIHELKYDQPFLVGVVEDIAFDTALSKEAKIKGWYLQKLVKSYINVLSSVGDIDISMDNLPKEPIELAYMAAMLLQAPYSQKQVFLEINAADNLILTIYDACRREIPVLRNMLNPTVSPHQDGPFSLN